MALVKCPECKEKVSDTAKTCPHCGFDLVKYREVKTAAEIQKHIVRRESLNIPDKNKPKVPFYKQTFWILFFLLFFPPVGIYLFIKYAKKPQKTARIIVSILYAVFWVLLFILGIINSSRYVDIDGKSVKISCGGYCSKLENIGDDNVFEYLAKAGITKITMARMGTSKTTITLENGRQALIYIEGGKISKICDSEYESVVYYSSDETVELATYPAKTEIEAAEAAAEAEEKQQEAEDAEQKAAQEAEDAKYPSEAGARELCEKQFHQNYPYNGSKVHSIVGVIASQKHSGYTYLYKVNVTIQNAFGASYDAVMECVVEKSGEYIKIKSFYIY